MYDKDDLDPLKQILKAIPNYKYYYHFILIFFVLSLSFIGLLILSLFIFKNIFVVISIEILYYVVISYISHILSKLHLDLD